MGMYVLRVKCRTAGEKLCREIIVVAANSRHVTIITFQSPPVCKTVSALLARPSVTFTESLSFFFKDIYKHNPNSVSRFFLKDGSSLEMR